MGAHLLIGRLMPATAGDATSEAVDSARAQWDLFVDALPRLGVAIGVLVFGYLISRLIRMIAFAILKVRRSPSFAKVLSKVAGWFALALIFLSATVVAFPSVQPVDMLAGLGFFSLAVGFAFQDILENSLSGMLLLFRQPFQSGDQIEVQGQLGTVQAITIRETQIKTFDGQLVLIPNRDVYKSILRIQTHFPERRVSFVVGIAYENDVGEACDVIGEALAGVGGVLSDPRCEVLVTELGVSTVDIEARFWTASRQSNVLAIRDAAIKSVKRALDDRGIEMPADIVALQATPSFKAALQGDAEVTPGGAIRVVRRDDID